MYTLQAKLSLLNFEKALNSIQIPYLNTEAYSSWGPIISPGSIYIYPAKKAVFIEISVKTLLVKGQPVRIIRLPSYCKDFECPPLFGAVFQNGQTRKTFVLLFCLQFVLLLRKVKDINDDRIRTESGQIVTRNAYLFICMCMLQCRPLLV